MTGRAGVTACALLSLAALAGLGAIAAAAAPAHPGGSTQGTGAQGHGTQGHGAQDTAVPGTAATDSTTRGRLRREGPPDSPQQLFPGLFAAVQEAEVFADGKEFADATPTVPPARILAAYRALRPTSRDDLAHFVARYFSQPSAVVPPRAAPEKVTLIAHIDQLWDPLTRRTPDVPAYSSLLPLPRPYVVPGGRFREIYYWDTYFTMLGLVQSGRRDLVADMVDDFARFIDRFGHMPNGARTYYLSRSQPPFFYAMVALLFESDPAAGFARYLPQLEREYAYWMRGESGLARGRARRHVAMLPDGSPLNRYWDERGTPRDESYREDVLLARGSPRVPRELFREIRAAAESGWDFSSRWFADGRTRATLNTTHIVPVDLNGLLYGLERAIENGCRRRAAVECADRFARFAERRRAAIDRYLWDERTGAYLDYDWTREARIPRVSAATLYPLFVGLASPSQATAVAVTTERELLRHGGIVATPVETGEQWDSPNGWAPLQWIAVAGLRRYGHRPLAAQVACRWMAGVREVYEGSGKLVEKYDVVDSGRRGGGGEYPTQDGFGWTNGVMRRLSSLYPAADPDSGDAAPPDAADACPSRGAEASPSVK